MMLKSIPLLAACFLVASTAVAFASGIPGQVQTAGCTFNTSCMAREPNFSKLSEIAAQSSSIELLKHVEIKKCLEDFNKRDFQKTVELCNVIAKNDQFSNRERATAIFVLGHAFMQIDVAKTGFEAESLKRTIDSWKIAHVVDPTFNTSVIALSKLYHDLGETDLSLTTINRLAVNGCKDSRVYAALSDALIAAQNYTEALSAAEFAAGLDPSNHAVYLAKGDALLANDRFEEAITQLSLATFGFDPIRDDPYSMTRAENPWSRLADAYKANGQPAQAAYAMTRYIESDPRAAGGFYNFKRRAEYFESSGQLKLAADDLARSAKLAPEPLASEYTVQSTILLAKTLSKNEAVNQMRIVLASGKVKPILQIQVYLKGAGFAELKINGLFDTQTRQALDNCLKDKKCGAGAGDLLL